MTDRRQVAPHRVRQATAQGSQESAAGPIDHSSHRDGKEAEQG
jgi:hypothetical protein